MSKREWSEKQLQSIEARGGSVLVSAAAGSGKTSVLVERIIRRITDPVAPVDVDRLLVVTFTRAAAGELRERLYRTLSKEVAEHPENSALARQLFRLSRAQISTIHSFCQKVLKEHFHYLIKCQEELDVVKKKEK